MLCRERRLHPHLRAFRLASAGSRSGNPCHRCHLAAIGLHKRTTMGRLNAWVPNLVWSKLATPSPTGRTLPGGRPARRPRPVNKSWRGLRHRGLGHARWRGFCKSQEPLRYSGITGSSNAGSRRAGNRGFVEVRSCSAFPEFQKSCALAQWYWAGTVNARTSAHTQ